MSQAVVQFVALCRPRATTVAHSRPKALISDDFGVHKSLLHNDLSFLSRISNLD